MRWIRIQCVGSLQCVLNLILVSSSTISNWYKFEITYSIWGYLLISSRFCIAFDLFYPIGKKWNHYVHKLEWTRSNMIFFSFISVTTLLYSALRSFSSPFTVLFYRLISILIPPSLCFSFVSNTWWSDQFYIHCIYNRVIAIWDFWWWGVKINL